MTVASAALKFVYHYVMRKIILSLVLLVYCAIPSFAKKVLSVKGEKVIVSTRNLDGAEEGAVFKTFSGPYQSGKIKIKKIRRGKGLAVVMSGVVSPGDQLKLSDEEVTELYKNFVNYGFAGIEFIQPQMTSSPFKIEYDLHTALSLSYLRGNDKIRFEGKFLYGVGSGSYAVGSIDSSFWQITGGINYFLWDKFYARGATGLFMGTIDISANAQQGFPGAEFKLMGLPVNMGGGYEFELFSAIWRAELFVNYNYYFSAELGGNSTKLTDQLLYGLGIHGGMRF